MTKKQKKEVIRVCGKNYESSDVPALWRQTEKSQADQSKADDLTEDNNK